MIKKELQTHQKHIKDNTDNFAEQMVMFKNLKQLLMIKVKAVKEGGDGMIGYQDENAGHGVDRFIVRD